MTMRAPSRSVMSIARRDEGRLVTPKRGGGTSPGPSSRSGRPRGGARGPDVFAARGSAVVVEHGAQEAVLGDHVGGATRIVRVARSGPVRDERGDRLAIVGLRRPARQPG